MRWPLMLLLLAPAVATAQPDELPQFRRLDNGLLTCAAEDRSLPLVSVQVWYRVGLIDDPPDRPGLTRQVMASRVRAAAPTPRAVWRHWRVDPDAAWFCVIVPANELDSALAEARSILTGGATPAQTPQSAPANDDWLPKAARDGLFAGHDYARLARSEQSAVAAPADLQRHAEAWFAPANATVFIIGDIATDSALRRAADALGDLPWSAAAARPIRDDAAAHCILQTTPQALRLAWTGRGSFGNSAAVQRVLLQALANPLDGPLAGANWRITGETVALRHAFVGTAEFVRSGPASEPEKLEARLAAALDSLAKQPLSEIALNRARAQAGLALRLAHDDFARRCVARAAAEIIEGDILLFDLAPAAVARVGAADVQDAAVRLRSLLPGTPEVAAAESTLPLRWHAPPLDARRHAPPVELQTPAGIRARLFATPGAPLLHVRAAGAAAPAPSAFESLQDLMSYRGIRAEVRPSPSELSLAGPPHELPALFELAVRLGVDFRDAGLQLEVIGDAERAAVEAALDAAAAP